MRIGVDHSLYSLRNLVERFFNKLKNARRVATRYEYICKIWTSEPDRFIVNPIHQMLGLNT
jgi:transposase